METRPCFSGVKRGVNGFAVLILGLALIATPARGENDKDGGCRPFDHSHAAWSSILEQYTREGRVDYARLKKEGEEGLASYLASLESVCSQRYPSWSKEQRLAFWINAYNAYTIKLILDNYPVKSIRSIGTLPLAAFRKSFVPIGWYHGKNLSLNDIENGILRALFEEPRIHFAIVCASESCPTLRSEAYRATDLERQLEESARAFIRDTTKNRFDADANKLYLSKIFDWFKGDFVTAKSGLADFVAPYMDETAASHMARKDPKIRFLDYDWSLNGK